MLISKSGDEILFRTPFSETCDLVQKFTGTEEFPSKFNHTINFTEAGLVLKHKWDTWHLDIPFAISNDEAPPALINGEYLGANHVFCGGQTLYIPQHGKTCEDIGSVWQDAEGTKWILISQKEDTLTFISENIGESQEKYQFKKHIASRLIYVENGVHTDEIDAEVESWTGALKPIIRHNKRRVVAYINGKKRVVNRTLECDYAEIHEEYEIVNPASMVEQICKERPLEGYKTEIYSAMGDAMLKVSRIYRIQSDGTVLCEFECEKLMNIHFSRCMGDMFQEKLDTYRGGIYRYIPKMKPIDTPQGNFDFSVPFKTNVDTFPKSSYVTKEYWENKDNPPDRIVDYFYNDKGKACVGFVCGYLPLYDAKPEIRTKQLKSAIHLVDTRKGYPFFMDGDIAKTHGIAYRRYFKISKDGVSFYTIPCGEKMYLYIDFFKKNTLSIPMNGEVCLCEKSDGIVYDIKNKEMIVKGKKGYAVFVTDDASFK